MTGRFPPEPSAATLANIVIAQARSRLAVTKMTDQYNASLLSIFRNEVGGCVSRISGFLVVLLTTERYDIDELAWSIQPAKGWPFLNPASGPRDLMKCFREASKHHGYQKRELIRDRGGAIFPIRDGGHARLRLNDDCIDVTANIAGRTFVSSAGLVRVTVPWLVSSSVITASIGQTLSDVIDLTVCSNRDWPVISVEQMSSSPGCTFVANVGTRPYVLPWARYRT